jgi:hypothetical protein
VSAKPRRGRRVLRALGAFAMLGVLAALAAITILERRAVVVALPGTAPAFAAIGLPVAPGGLEFRNVKVEWIEGDGQAELDVRGEIHNVSTEDRVVPLVAVWIRNRAGEELIQWPARVGLGAVSKGGFTRFQARIPAPPSVTAVTASVLVRFAATR